MQVSANGTISNPQRTSTGGKGSIASDGTAPLARDALISQGSVIVGGEYLFTVNAGSNTLAMFSIDPQDASRVTLVGAPASTLGEFPMSVTYSDTLNMACVLNGGAKAGVTCFHVDRQGGLQPTGSFLSLAGITNETTPPVGPPESSSQILFTPDSSALLVLQKGNAGPPVSPGYIVAYPVVNGRVSGNSVKNQFANVAMPFAGVFVDNDRVFMADPSYGASIFEIPSDLELVQQTHVVLPTQKAVCWSAYDASLNTAYAIDAGQPLVYTFDPSSGAQTGSFSPDESVQGLFDSAISDGKMYSLAAANGIVVMDLVSQTQVQFYNLTSFGNRQYWDGMAVSW
ncbi:hypothetical protein LTS14_002077 [Recurvomyces mirabilis]|nr:hypothetical protein LTS14_002077 [Recurvomyces mirabilis]